MTRAIRSLPQAATPPAGTRPAARNGQTSKRQLPVALVLDPVVLAPVLTAIGRNDGPMAHSLVRSWLVGQGYPANVDLAINIEATVTVSKAKEETP